MYNFRDCPEAYQELMLVRTQDFAGAWLIDSSDNMCVHTGNLAGKR